MKKRTPVKVHVGFTAKGRDKWKRFDSLADAKAMCAKVFASTGRVLSIVLA